MSIKIHLYDCTQYDDIPFTHLKQIALMRWYDDDPDDPIPDDDEDIVKDMAYLRAPLFKHVSFYVYAVTDEDDVVAFVQFLHDNNDGPVWAHGDLETIEKYKRRGIATRMMEEAIRYLRNKNAAKLLAYIAVDNFVSITFHEKLGFVRCENQDTENIFAGECRAIYEYIF